MMTVGFWGLGDKGNSPFAFYETLLARALSRGYNLFYFSESDINAQEKKIYGTFYDVQSKCYYKRLVPYPDIIEIPNKKLKSVIKKPGVRDMLRECVFTQTHGYADKTKLNEILQKNNLEKYDIKTWRYADFDAIYFLEQLQKYQSLVFKPINAKGGESIYCLKMNADGKLTVIYEKEEISISESDFLTQYNQLFSSSVYIVQPFFNFKTNDGAPFDIRLNLHRGRKGKWEHIDTFIRVGNKKGIVSNLSSGGYIIKEGLENFLDDQVGGAKKILSEVEFISKNLGEIIQNGYSECTIATIALDLAVDRNNNNEIKIIEINSSPIILPSLMVYMAKSKVAYWEYIYPRKVDFLRKAKKMYLKSSK